MSQGNKPAATKPAETKRSDKLLKDHTHAGKTYPKGTPLSKLENLTEEQKDFLSAHEVI